MWLSPQIQLVRQGHQQNLIVHRIRNNGQVRQRMNIDRELRGGRQREDTTHGLVQEINHRHRSTQVIRRHESAAGEIVCDRAGADAHADASGLASIWIEEHNLVIRTGSDHERVRDRIERHTLRKRNRAGIGAMPMLDAAQLASLYAEFADEDSALAEEGMSDYAEGLRQEDTP